MKKWRAITLFTLFIVMGSLARAGSMEEAHRHYFNGDPKGALGLYKEILELGPCLEAGLNAALVAEELGHHQEGIGILKGLEKTFPDDPKLLSELGWALLNEGFIDEAEDRFQKLTSTAPVYLMDKMGMALVHYEKGRFPEAEAILNDILSFSPNSTLATYFLGRAYEKMGRSQEAIAAYQGVVKKDSHFIEPRLKLGRLYEEAKSADDAYAQYTKVGFAHAGNRKAQAGLERVKNNLSKEPGEIIRSKSIEAPTTVPLPPSGEGALMVRVGIGTSPSGQPTQKSAISFKTSAPFTIVGEKKGVVIGTGGAGEFWAVRLNASKTKAEIANPSKKVVGSFQGSIFIKQTSTGAATTIIKSLVFAKGMPWGGMGDRELRGDIEITMNRNKRRIGIINHVSLEEYVYGVLAAEMPAHWPLEALKVQAVIARTLALYRTQYFRPHKKNGYDLCDEQHCQVYTGVQAENEKVRQAVNETGGEVLLYEGKPAHTVFSSNCGGQTQSGAQAGWGTLPYWKSVSDAKEGTPLPASPWELKKFLKESPALYCEGSQHIWFPEYRWTRVVSAEELAEKVRRKEHVGRIRQIYILERNPTGRIRKVQIVGTESTLTLRKEHEIRKYLGVGLLRSNLFVMDTVVRDGKAQAFIFYGGGWGHGVGLCQSGAAGRADAGQSYQEILKTYYPGITLSSEAEEALPRAD